MRVCNCCYTENLQILKLYSASLLINSVTEEIFRIYHLGKDYFTIITSDQYMTFGVTYLPCELISRKFVEDFNLYQKLFVLFSCSCLYISPLCVGMYFGCLFAFRR